MNNIRDSIETNAFSELPLQYVWRDTKYPNGLKPTVKFKNNPYSKYYAKTNWMENYFKYYSSHLHTLEMMKEIDKSNTIELFDDLYQTIVFDHFIPQLDVYVCITLLNNL
jgi:hypothetical protein